MVNALRFAALALFCWSSAAQECDTDTCDNRLDDQSAFIQVKLQKGAVMKADNVGNVYCPDGYTDDGIGYYTNFESAGKKVIQGKADMYSCALKCQEDCAAFTLFKFEVCWIYTATSSLKRDSNSKACKKIPSNCPSGYKDAGLGWWQNADKSGSSEVMKTGANVYTCAAKCTGSCIGFSVYDFNICWIYTQLQEPLVTGNANSGKSRACQQYSWAAKYTLLQVDSDAAAEAVVHEEVQHEGGNCPSGYRFKGFGWWNSASTGGATKSSGAYDVYSCETLCEETYGCKAFSVYNWQDCWVYTSIYGEGFNRNDPNSHKSIACKKESWWSLKEKSAEIAKIEKKDDSKKDIESHEVQVNQGNCPSGYYDDGLGWYSNVDTHSGVTRVMSSGADLNTCAAQCGYGCVAFSVWGWKDCWIYSYVQYPVVTSSKSRACKKWWALSEESAEVTKKEDSENTKAKEE